jgi:hypothetical protein
MPNQNQINFLIELLMETGESTKPSFNCPWKIEEKLCPCNYDYDYYLSCRETKNTFDCWQEVVEKLYSDQENPHPPDYRWEDVCESASITLSEAEEKRHLRSFTDEELKIRKANQ